MLPRAFEVAGTPLLFQPGRQRSGSGILPVFYGDTVNRGPEICYCCRLKMHSRKTTYKVTPVAPMKGTTA